MSLLAPLYTLFYGQGRIEAKFVVVTCADNSIRQCTTKNATALEKKRNNFESLLVLERIESAMTF